MRTLIRSLITMVVLCAAVTALRAEAWGCEVLTCSTADPDVGVAPGSLVAGLVTGQRGDPLRVASNSSVSQYTYRLVTPCDFTDPRLGGCTPVNRDCPQPPGRVVTYYYVLAQRLAQPGGAPVDGLVPGPADPAGRPYGPVTNQGGSCVDVTDLNPAPTPDEVYRYFQTLPLPQLDTIEQPPGTALVGLPVVFHTDGPTTQTYDLTIRGFAVHITATATTYTWHTGDGTDLTTTSPGAPWPDTTATHDYRSGTYTSSLTTTWGATFTVDGGPSTLVPGSTTTTGPATTFTVVQAHPVLTNPYD